VALLKWWFETEHLTENADGSHSPFLYFFAQREAVETLVWLYDVRRARDKFDLLRFDASGAASSGIRRQRQRKFGRFRGVAPVMSHPAVRA